MTNIFDCKYLGCDEENMQKMMEPTSLLQLGQHVATERLATKTNDPYHAKLFISDVGVRVSEMNDSGGEILMLKAKPQSLAALVASSKTRVAVFIAKTKDSDGQKGLGCDVLKLKASTEVKTILRVFDELMGQVRIQRHDVQLDNYVEVGDDDDEDIGDGYLAMLNAG